MLARGQPPAPALPGSGDFQGRGKSEQYAPLQRPASKNKIDNSSQQLFASGISHWEVDVCSACPSHGAHATGDTHAGAGRATHRVPARLGTRPRGHRSSATCTTKREAGRFGAKPRKHMKWATVPTSFINLPSIHWQPWPRGTTGEVQLFGVQGHITRSRAAPRRSSLTDIYLSGNKRTWFWVPRRGWRQALAAGRRVPAEGGPVRELPVPLPCHMGPLPTPLLRKVVGTASPQRLALPAGQR